MTLGGKSRGNKLDSAEMSNFHQYSSNMIGSKIKRIDNKPLSEIKPQLRNKKGATSKVKRDTLSFDNVPSIMIGMLKRVNKLKAESRHFIPSLIGLFGQIVCHCK